MAQIIQGRYTHCTEADRVSRVIRTLLVHVKRVDWKRLATNHECRVDLSITIKDPDVPAKGVNGLQLSTLGTGVESVCDLTITRQIFV